jgi:hypothetical protein
MVGTVIRIVEARRRQFFLPFAAHGLAAGWRRKCFLSATPDLG